MSVSKVCVWNLVRSIPRGMVMTYGQIADHLAETDQASLTARAVGRAMGDAPNDVPWHRVVNARGTCSVDSDGKGRQQKRLCDEGVEFRNARLPLARYRWVPER